MSDEPHEPQQDAEDLLGQHHVWIKKFLRGYGVFTLQFGWINTGRPWELSTRLNAEHLARGWHAYGEGDQGHLIAMKLIGDTLRVWHPLHECYLCAPEQTQ